MSNNSRTANSVKNIMFGFISQAIQMVLGFISRTIFIRYLAVEYLGVNSLFSNILSMLSLAELGVGSAFIFSLYKPLAEKNEVAIATILRFYKKVYTSIGTFIFVAGIILMPFLHQIIPHKPEAITEDIRLIYFIFLFNSASSYFFSYKMALLDADQKSSITTFNSAVFLIIQNIIQIIVLVLTRNFIFYLLVQVVVSLTSNLFISRIVDKRYPFLKAHQEAVIDAEVKHKIISNTKATFLVKIGGLLVNSTDNLIINYFVGLALLGKFSNYLMLIAMGTNFLAIIFANAKSSVANVTVLESKSKQVEIFKAMNFANFWAYGVSSILIVFMVNDFITIWIGKSYTLAMAIPIMLAINFFMVGMQNAFWTFKSVYGFFQYGKYMVLLTALINLIFSFGLGYFYGIFGVLLATAIARLITNFWYDPYIVLKLGLQMNPMTYLNQFLKYVAILVLSGFIIYFISLGLHFSILANSLIRLVLCLVIPNMFIIVFFKNKPEFQKVVEIGKRTLNILIKKVT